MKRPFYAFQLIAGNFVGLGSRALHTFVFLGHPGQTLSARSHVEFGLRGKWHKRRRLINFLFFWQRDHCEDDWKRQVERARRTLELDKALYRQRRGTAPRRYK